MLGRYLTVDVIVMSIIVIHEIGHGGSRDRRWEWAVDWPFSESRDRERCCCCGGSTPSPRNRLFATFNCGPPTRQILINHSFLLSASIGSLWKGILFVFNVTFGNKKTRRYRRPHRTIVLVVFQFFGRSKIYFKTVFMDILHTYYCKITPFLIPN